MEFTITATTMAILGVCALPVTGVVCLLWINRKQLYKIPLLPYYIVKYAFNGVIWYIKGIWEEPNRVAFPGFPVRWECILWMVPTIITLTSIPILTNLCYNGGILNTSCFIDVNALPAWLFVTNGLSITIAGIITLVLIFLPTLARQRN